MEEKEEEVEEAPELDREERRRTIHNLIQTIVDFMLDTSDFE